MMNQQLINKEVTEEDLNQIYNSFEKLNNELNSIGLEIFKNETNKNLLSKPSHYIFSIIHRAIELNRGFQTLAKSNNWITAINLIRLQTDNCMRLFALSLVENRPEFYNQVINGEHIRNIKDSNGKKMTDLYLSQQLEKLYPGFRLLYENTSGFIHFSNKHINFNNDIVKNENEFIMYVRLGETTEFQISEKVDFTYNMFYVGNEILLRLLKGYQLSMIKFMNKIQ